MPSYLWSPACSAARGVSWIMRRRHPQQEQLEPRSQTMRRNPHQGDVKCRAGGSSLLRGVQHRLRVNRSYNSTSVSAHGSRQPLHQEQKPVSLHGARMLHHFCLQRDHIHERVHRVRELRGRAAPHAGCFGGVLKQLDVTIELGGCCRHLGCLLRSGVTNTDPESELWRCIAGSDERKQGGLQINYCQGREGEEHEHFVDTAVGHLLRDAVRDAAGEVVGRMEHRKQPPR
mmetsp:Transcript_41458/g.117298  ORF Transcript_41458/g.117298 Transcript_41458/m.117298 type:complete len:230 (-) Transcript_41458:1969-2658(-)